MKHRIEKVILTTLLLVTATATLVVYFNRPFRIRIAAYVTDLSNRSSAQRVNIERVGQAVSGVVLKSGDTFSLNQQAGPYTKDRGFLPERSFLGRQLVWTPGGGVCQAASTLYNAAQRAGLEILERVPHTQAVSSVPPGQDATLAYGVADLKFRNNHPYPIKIVTKIVRDQLLIEIWGKEENHDHSNL